METCEAMAKHIQAVQFNFLNAPDTGWDSNILDLSKRGCACVRLR